MAGQETTFAEQSWAFALKLYGRPGVSEACLCLQSVAATDVMFLLVVLFAATQKNIDLRSDDISGLDDACRPWREQVIKPLRGVRSALKTLAPAQRSAEAEALRARVKADELQAERIENALLGDLLQDRAGAPTRLTPGQIDTCIRAVIHQFGGHIRDDAVAADLATIVTAALEISY
jgi:uncharacterized protein (TIGR02444 family)